MTPLRSLRARRATLLLAALLAAGPGCDGDGHSTGSSYREPDRNQNGLVSVDQTKIRAEVAGSSLRVEVPVSRVSDDEVDTELLVDLVSVDGQRVLSSQRAHLAFAGATSVAKVTLQLPESSDAQADLVRYNLRVHDGTEHGLMVLRSAFAALPRYEVSLEGPARLSVDKRVSYRVRAHDPKTYAAVPEAKVELVLTRAGQAPRTLSTTTDEHGDAFFELSLDEAGDYQASARATNAGTVARLSESVVVESGTGRLMLTTDKPIYQPGQLVHLRALALDKGSNQPVAASPVRFEIRDGKGNKVFKREVKSDAFGIAAVRFRLGTVLNMGTFAASAIVGELESKKSFEVSRYVLPKFAVDVDLDKPWYEAGASVEGTVDARYFFGKDVAGASVEITGSTVDIGQNAFAHVVGKTRADGTMPFSLTLPNSLVGLPLEQGNALVSLHVAVTDTAGQEVEKDVAVTVASQPAMFVVVPEDTALVPGVANRLHVFASDPAGAPLASAHVTVSGAGAQAEGDTDAFGQLVLEVTPTGITSADAALHAELVHQGKRVSKDFSFAAQQGTEHLLVRTDRAVYDVGDTVEVEIHTTDRGGSVYVDWLNEGQDIEQQTLQAKDGVARFSVTLDAGHVGDNRIEAYVVDAGGNVSRAGSTLFVRQGGALDVELATDKASYAPGEPAALTFTVKDEAGKPAVAALGVQIVDEAVFALVEATPGLLRTYFELDDAFATPHYELEAPAGSMPELVFEDTRAADEAAEKAAQNKARATFAALGQGGIMGVHAGSWSATIAAVAKLLEPTYESEQVALAGELKKVASDGAVWLARQGCASDQYFCDALQTDYGSAIVSYVSEHFAAYDAWGKRYTLTDDGSSFALLTAGPDEVGGNEDDAALHVAFSDVGIQYSRGIAEDANAGAGGDFGDPTAGGEPPATHGGDGSSGGDGSAEPRVRRDFPETLYVNPAIITGPDGKAKIEVPLADSITEWRVSTLANSQDGKLGGGAHGIRVFQDFFVDVAFPATLTRGDEVSVPIALYNYLDTPQQVEVTLESAAWYTPLGGTSATVQLAAKAVQGISFPVRVNEVGTHMLTVKAVGAKRSDAVERAVRVVPDGKAFPTAQSGALAPGNVTLTATYPANAVQGSGELSLSIFPAFVASAVAGMDSILAEPNGCFEQTTSTTWPNVLVLRYMRDTKQVTPEIELKAESYISAGYQRLLTFEHPNGGFSWFGTQDPAPFLSVTAFGVMEFADMAKVYEVDQAMVQRTIDWLVAQQKADGTWVGDMTEFFSFNTSLLRNTAFVVWSLASAGHQGPEIERGLSYLRTHYKDEKSDGYTLALVANAFAAAAPNDATLDAVITLLDGMKKVSGDKVSWDAGATQTQFYGAGNDAEVTTTALVAHALLLAGSHPDLVKGAIDTLVSSRDQAGNFGSTQATVWSLRTLLLAATKGTDGAVGTLDVAVDGVPFTSLALTKDQSDVMTTVDLATLATTGSHDVTLSFAGTGKVSYNLVSSYHVPWSEVPPEEPGPLAVSVKYDRTSLAVNDTASATVTVDNVSGASAHMILVDVGIPPGFAVETDDLDAYLAAGTLSKYEITPRQLILYVTELAAGARADYTYRVRATMPVKAADGGAEVYPYYEPDQRTHAASTTLTAM